MGTLTDAMKHLRDEIVSARLARRAFQSELIRTTEERRRQVSALCAAFAGDRLGAHRAWFGPAVPERQTAGKKQRKPPRETLFKRPAER